MHQFQFVLIAICTNLAIVPAANGQSRLSLTGARVLAVTNHPLYADGGVHGMADPAVNEHGEAAFRSSDKMWLYHGGLLKNLASAGGHAVGAPEGHVFANFSFLSKPLLSNDGLVAFAAFTENSSPLQGIWTFDRDDSLRPVAISGGLAPGASGVTFDSFSTRFEMSTTGLIAIQGRLETGAEGVWAQPSMQAPLELIALGGMAEPVSGRPFDSFFSAFDINSTGDVVFVARIPNELGVREYGVWHQRPNGRLRQVTLGGDALAGLVTSDAINARLDELGNIDVETYLEGARPPTRPVGAFLFPADGSEPELLLNTWQDAPILAGNELVTSFGFVHTTSGTTFLHTWISGAGVTAENDEFFFLRDASGAFHSIARLGDPAPGTENGVSFRELRPEHVNERGEVIFEGVLQGPGTNSFNNSGLWLSRSDGSMELLLRTGDTMEIAPGEIKTVRRFRVNSSDPFTDNGYYATVAYYRDLGSSREESALLLFVPEPSAFTLLGVAAVMLGMGQSVAVRRRRRVALVACPQCGHACDSSRQIRRWERTVCGTHARRGLSGGILN